MQGKKKKDEIIKDVIKRKKILIRNLNNTINKKKEIE